MGSFGYEDFLYELAHVCGVKIKLDQLRQHLVNNKVIESLFAGQNSQARIAVKVEKLKTMDEYRR